MALNTMKTIETNANGEEFVDEWVNSADYNELQARLDKEKADEFSCGVFVGFFVTTIAFIVGIGLYAYLNKEEEPQWDWDRTCEVFHDPYRQQALPCPDAGRRLHCTAKHSGQPFRD